MSKTAFNILRLGLAFTFLGVGVFILQSPDAWGMMLQPWALRWLPSPLHQMMVATAYLDITIGFFLLINRLVWVAAFLGAIHLMIVLVTVGITFITIRDVGLFFASLALFWSAPSPPWRHRIVFWRR